MMKNSIGILALLLCAAPSATVNAADGTGPGRVECKEKTFPNVKGQNAVVLQREPNGGYRATYEAYGPAKTKKKLTCVFDANPLVFHCSAGDAWALISTKVDEREITSDGKAHDNHVYKIEAVRNPAGEPHVESEFRFALDSCKNET